jgi:hypothetical protein
MKATTKPILDNSDFHLWIEKTVRHLQNREFHSLDIDLLIEELENLTRSDKNALKNTLIILLAHLLKLRVQSDAPETMKNSWYASVDEHRQRVQEFLEDIPSLKSFLSEAIENAYPKAQKLAIKEGKRAKFGVRIPDESEYPSSCPFLLGQVLDDEFYGS